MTRVMVWDAATTSWKQAGGTQVPVDPTVGYRLVIGWIQSNMRGAANDYSAPTDTALSNVYEWDWATGSIVPAALPGSNLDGFNGIGVMTSFANDYAAAHPTEKVLRVNVARGGTGFATPSTNTSNGVNYTALSWRHDLPDTANNLALVATRQVAAVLAAAGDGSKIVAMLANHGSTDGTQNTPKATFKGYLQEWITWMRTQLPVTGVPYVMMQMRPDLVAAETRHAIIDAAQAETATELADVGYVLAPTDTSNFKADSVHFNAQGVREIGHRLYTRYAEMAATAPLTNKKIALIGDSTLWQDGFGEARMRALLEPTFKASNIFFYAASGKDIYSADANGYNTLTNIAQARAALGGEPDLWLINLGSNGHNTTDSDINYKINLIMSQLTAPVLWNAISQKDGYVDGTASVATRLNWNTKASAKMATYTNGRWMDWHAYVKAKPGGDDSLWRTDYVHMTNEGYDYKNAYNFANVMGIVNATTLPPVGTAALAGAKALGTTAYTVPSTKVLFMSTTGSDANPGTLASPKATLDGVYAAAASGDTIVIRGGEYRQNFASNVNKSLTFQSYPGEVVWFDGSDVVTGWSGSAPWTKSWTVEHDHSTSFTAGDTNTRWIDSAYPYAAWPDMLFIDGVRQTLVGPTATPSAGQWCHNYDDNQIKVGTNPAGKEIRVAVRERFCIIKQPDTTFRGIGIRRYATGLSQIGTIFGSTSGPRAIVENCWLVDCGQQSVSLSGSGSVLRSGSIVRPGCTGFHSANTTDITVELSWVDQANYRRFKNEPAAAAIKLTEQRGCLIKDSMFTGSLSYGIWFDTDTIDINVIGNKVSNCAGKGIHIEAGHNCIVAGNYVTDTPFGIMNMISSKWGAWNNAVDNTTQFDVGVWQDERRNTNPATKDEVPWIITDAQMANNVMTFKKGTTGHLYQMYALDRNTNRPANDMVSLLAGNLFSATSVSPLQSNQMIGWGGTTNIISGSMIYKTPAAFQAGVPKASAWVNSLTPYTDPTFEQIHAFDSSAVPLPANVAAALGLSVGTKLVGPPRPAPQLIASNPEGA